MLCSTTREESVQSPGTAYLGAPGLKELSWLSQSEILGKHIDLDALGTVSLSSVCPSQFILGFRSPNSVRGNSQSSWMI